MEGLRREAAGGKASLMLSAVNQGEIVHIIQRKAGVGGRRKLLSVLDALPVTVVDADRGLVLAAAEMKIKAKPSVSYADCFALALDRRSGGTVVTGDQEFKKTEGVASVHWLPEKPNQR